jgi:hypothetical protein
MKAIVCLAVLVLAFGLCGTAAAAPTWFEFEFTGADLWALSPSYDASAETAQAQEAPRRHFAWNSTTWEKEDVTTTWLYDGNPAGETGTLDETYQHNPPIAGDTGYGGWMAAQGTEYQWGQINLWGAGAAYGGSTNAHDIWGEKYISVGDITDPGGPGVDSWEIISSPPGWTSGIVIGGEDYSANEDHAFPVWRQGTGQAITLANKDDPSFVFRFRVLISNPGTAFEADGSIRAFFGGSKYADDDPLYDTDFQEVNGVMKLFPIPEAGVFAAFSYRVDGTLGPAEPVTARLDATISKYRMPIATIGGRLTYDAARLTGVTLEKGAGIPASWSFIYSSTSTPGEVDFVLTEKTGAGALIASTTLPLTIEVVKMTFNRLTPVSCTPVFFGYNTALPTEPPAAVNAFPDFSQYVQYISDETVLTDEVTSLTIETGPMVDDHAFIRGNVNDRSARALNIADVLDVAAFLFLGYTPTFDCQAAFDANDDGARNITDLVTLVHGIFNPTLVTIRPPNSTDPGPGIPGVVVPDGGTIPSLLGCAEGEVGTSCGCWPLPLSDDFSDPSLPGWSAIDVLPTWVDGRLKGTGNMMRCFQEDDYAEISFGAQIRVGGARVNNYSVVLVGERGTLDQSYFLVYGIDISSRPSGTEGAVRLGYRVDLSDSLSTHNWINQPVPIDDAYHSVSARRDASGLWTLAVDGTSWTYQEEVSDPNYTTFGEVGVICDQPGSWVSEVFVAR